VAQSFLLIASDSNATVLMPSSNDKEAYFDVPVKENPPCIQEEESEGEEEGPILTRDPH
jgi:hypothetical protein